MANADAKRELANTESKEMSVVKRVKVDHVDRGAEENKSEGDNILSGFQTTNVLSDSAREKIIFVHGKIADQDAVVILEKTPIRKDMFTELLSCSTLRLDMKNDIYSTYRLQVPPHLNEIKTTVVYPATQKHLKKYQQQESFLVEESVEDYESITLPYIQQQSFSLQWVYNILEKKAEADKIVYEDPNPDLGFVLLPDFKWDQKQVNDPKC
ncbi:m7GpppX diphosphatase [Nematolebias whitei]|uniref:m7GpppX diphosphatase n=1 Tax=Nematolebias whitei TaxID=451745 RepID=UPI0018996E03|nr:m7GpppX diphosphatase [Nematolebias whitei]